MKRPLLLGTIGVLLYSCQQGISPVAHFNPENLASQQVSINTNRDTVVQLQGGTALRIPAHALEGEHGDTVGTMAPTLLGAIDRWRNDTNNLFYYIRFAQDLVSDQYTCCLRRKYNTQMSRHNQLDEDSLKEIFTYVREEVMKKR
ncbi:hypothetical protein [[Flexibacter] sp. ATCC 35208]|uniref:hypothetical protein n=1 Tax=[Flexibacter] sp. ATCC 35208 TaxID=1936242 RepID=UPI001180E075|nr:hypothetical protein [[Flexibacter] sp. ATCC 35208]